MFDVLTTPLDNCSGSSACPSGSATPEAVKAAFSRTVDWFKQAGARYFNPVLDMADRDLFKYQMFSCWKELLCLDWQENSRAVDIAFAAWNAFEAGFRRQARRTLDELEQSGRIGLVMLGRPYHHDPGLNQGIRYIRRVEEYLFREFQSQDMGGKVCSPPSESHLSGVIELQMRPRCVYQQSDRANYRDLRQAALFISRFG